MKSPMKRLAENAKWATNEEFVFRSMSVETTIRRTSPLKRLAMDAKLSQDEFVFRTMSVETTDRRTLR